MDVVKIVKEVFCEAVGIIAMYYLILSFFGIIRFNKKSNVSPQKSFAMIVAAHNEEAVVKDVIESLNNLNYPKELYDVFVIADNCTDDTAAIARSLGANVFERFEKEKRGKGFALEWMFDKIFRMEKKYDAVAIFDADNLVSKDFLLEMNKKLVKGYKVVQGYLDSKNPKDTWITGCYSISFWSSNRLLQMSRSNLGLSSQLGGTGFCIETNTLKELGWGATCLTEDLEFTCKLVLNGHKVGWAHEAVVYDEKPLTLAQSWSQRKRWMQGFADVSSRYFFKLMKRAFTKFDFVAFDCAIYSIQPILLILFGISMLITVYDQSGKLLDYIYNIMKSGFSFSSINMGLISLLILQFIYTPFVLILDKKLNFKIFLYYILPMPIFALTWVPISIQGIINKDKKEWSHTKHTRSINIQELEQVN
ncbi:hypothetical protein SAMN02745163_02168 [Clostridium cavendishii DSM 21758]|uniref:Glycosyltransferase, catalytic subunit of cellulose synthase and poly-beta-1,6-N-acetylglucosamine synthase n=1 Tax=Clostridium cavendishii DSM 21758 TaxID=1121302 RepID=A0A1M6KDQ3_9CLOT|nr:glycosyltransferase family 2 protein [Clostridium cavendishii]SHJ57061.1 hypothetical protein SAMN02745163_02168 [Clostridium cavendishii DSM 21758]